MEPWLGEEEATAVYDYMRSGGWLMEHDKTRQFESMIADYTGASHCIAANNGTVSLTLASLACGVQAGDEVIVPNYTMIATANSVFMLGANPIFVDVEPETLCLDIDQTEAALTQKTRAIMLVTANGRYPRAGIETFVDLADKHGLVYRGCGPVARFALPGWPAYWERRQSRQLFILRAENHNDRTRRMLNHQR